MRERGKSERERERDYRTLVHNDTDTDSFTGFSVTHLVSDNEEEIASSSCSSPSFAFGPKVSFTDEVNALTIPAVRTGDVGFGAGESGAALAANSRPLMMQMRMMAVCVDILSRSWLSRSKGRYHRRLRKCTSSAAGRKH